LGQARVASQGRGRSVYVYGVTSGATDLWKVDVRQGSFLPGGDPRRGSAVTALGPRLARELFGERSAVGSFVRVSGWRLRVVGVMAPKGDVLGFDLDDIAWVPTATVMRMFDLPQLAEIDVAFARGDLADAVVRSVEDVLRQRHDGEEDVTVVTQDAMLDVLDRVLRAIGAGVVAIAAISLVVGAVGVLTVVWIAVGERTSEIGLLRALGATRRQILLLFLAEALLLALVGGLFGLLLMALLLGVLALAIPALPISLSPFYLLLALLLAAVVGLLAGVSPAWRAAGLNPVDALQQE
jgi:putative ABC transport system permease protein